MVRSGTFAAIDVGTTKICTIVGEVGDTGDIRVLGVGSAPAAGLSRGGVDNIREATEAIHTAVEKAERECGSRILSAHVGLSGAQVNSLNNRGIVAIPDRNRPVSQEDIARALEGAKIISLPANREILHVVPRYYVVDGQDSVTNALGMYGQRLDVEAHIITVASSAVLNVTKVVEAAGVQVDELILQPLAAAEAVLSNEEKRQGVVVVDIGGGCTDIAVFLDGSIHHTATIPLGGNHITRDIVVGLRCPYHAAEQAKERFGNALPSAVNPEDTIEIEAFGAERQRTYARRMLCEIIQARCEEILELVVNEVRRNAEPEFISAGLVLTGGSARLPGFDLLAEQVTRLPARIGLPGRIFGLVDELHDPTFAAAVGLLQWSAGEQDLVPQRYHNAGPGAFDGVFKKLSNWFRVLLPE
jgi:cell division protein FtsA